MSDNLWEQFCEGHRYLAGHPADILTFTADWHELEVMEIRYLQSFDDAIKKTTGRWTDLETADGYFIRFEHEQDLLVFRLAYNGQTNFSR